MRPGGILLLLLLSLGPAGAHAADDTREALPFRGYLQGYTNTDNPVFWDLDFWHGILRERAAEGYNAIVWYGPNEFTNGQHMLVGHRQFPEARELPAAESERIVAHWQAIFDGAHAVGLDNYLLTQHVFYTRAFAQAHGLLDPRPASATVSPWQSRGYPNFWPGDPSPIHHCGVRNELTRAYTEAVYVELAETYPSLDGFWGYAGEPLPGDRSTFYREAVLPALQRAARRPRYVASQWQIPLEGFLENVRDAEPGADLWLDVHGYNSEQITDAAPYPGVVRWARATGLPTVPDIYPANQRFFPFNSPRLAHEIVTEIRRAGLTGFLYYERHVSGTLLGPLFRQALARYGRHHEPWSPDPWVEQLQQQVGNATAAAHLLAAYDAGARVIPETCALVYSGGDVLRRELRLPYRFFSEPFPWSYTTSPARGGRLVPVRHYARMLAVDAGRFTGNGAELDGTRHEQHPLWGSHGGSDYDVTPPQHMAAVRQLAARAHAEADAALEHASDGHDGLRRTRDIMEGAHRLAVYYEAKVAATVAALVHGHSRLPEHRRAAEAAADTALARYLEAARYLDGRVNPHYQALVGAPIDEAGVPLAELIEAEKQDRERIGELFGWDRD